MENILMFNFRIIKLNTTCYEHGRISKTYCTAEIIIQKYFTPPIALYKRKTGKKEEVNLLILVKCVSKSKYIIQAVSVTV